MMGINAPDQGECFADESRDHLVDTLEDNAVDLEIVDTDQFGRTLAHVFVGDRHVNLEMVANGLAIASGADDDSYGVALVAAEETAFGEGRGLWGACGDDDTADVVFDVPGSVVDPAGPDDDSLDQEYIVILNNGDGPIDLSAWILRDESTRHRFTFPDGTTLGPGESIRITSGDPAWDPGGGPVWNNDGDMALLQLPDGTVVDRWRY